jgi:hypothetical protein
LSGIDIFNHEYGIDPLKPYASRMFNCSVVGAHEMSGLMDTKPPQDVWLSIVFEFMYFYLALTKGHVLKDVPRQRRDEVMNGLVELLIPRVIDYIFDAPNENQRRLLKDQYLKMTRARLETYDEYKKLLADTENDLKGTAIGSLCDSVSELAGHPGNPMYEMACFSHINDTMGFLKIKTFVASVT